MVDVISSDVQWKMKLFLIWKQSGLRMSEITDSRNSIQLWVITLKGNTEFYIYNFYRIYTNVLNIVILYYIICCGWKVKLWRYYSIMTFLAFDIIVSKLPNLLPIRKWGRNRGKLIKCKTQLPTIGPTTINLCLLPFL